MREAVLGPRLLDTGIFDERFLEKIVAEHQSGVRDFSAPLWSLLMFEAFCRQREGETIPSSPESAALVAE